MKTATEPFRELREEIRLRNDNKIIQLDLLMTFRECERRDEKNFTTFFLLISLNRFGHNASSALTGNAYISKN